MIVTVIEAMIEIGASRTEDIEMTGMGDTEMTVSGMAVTVEGTTLEMAAMAVARNDGTTVVASMIDEVSAQVVDQATGGILLDVDPRDASKQGAVQMPDRLIDVVIKIIGVITERVTAVVEVLAVAAAAGMAAAMAAAPRAVGMAGMAGTVATRGAGPTTGASLGGDGARVGLPG